MGSTSAVRRTKATSSGTQTTSRVAPAAQEPAATVRHAMGAVEDLGQKLPDGQRIYWVWNVGVGVGGRGGGKGACVLRVVRGVAQGAACTCVVGSGQ